METGNRRERKRQVFCLAAALIAAAVITGFLVWQRGMLVEARSREAQEELAEMVSLSTSYISAIERGVKNPTLENFIAIANVLKVSSDELLGEELEVRFDIHMTQLGALLENLDDRAKERILHVVAVMIADAGK